MKTALKVTDINVEFQIGYTKVAYQKDLNIGPYIYQYNGLVMSLLNWKSFSVFCLQHCSLYMFVFSCCKIRLSIFTVDWR